MAHVEEIKKAHMDDLIHLIEEADRERRQALELLDRECLKTVQRLLDLRDHGKIGQVQLEAAKQLAKLAGLEVNQHEFRRNEIQPMTIVVKQYERLTHGGQKISS